MKDPVLVASRITKRLALRRVLEDVSLAVDPGEACVLVGDNGAGKSTLLRIVAGVLDPDRGDVTLSGASLRDQRARALSHLGYAPEHADIPEHLRASEWLVLVASLRRAASPDDAFLSRFDLGPFVHQRIATLSLGQRRRLALAAALLGAPALLVLDEPTNGLDTDSLSALSGIIAEHTAAGGAALLATHDHAWAARVASRVVRLEGGRNASSVVEQ